MIEYKEVPKLGTVIRGRKHTFRLVDYIPYKRRDGKSSYVLYWSTGNHLWTSGMKFNSPVRIKMSQAIMDLVIEAHKKITEGF